VTLPLFFFQHPEKSFGLSVAFVPRIDDTTPVATKKCSERLTRVVRQKRFTAMSENQITSMTDADLLKLESCGGYWERSHARDERYRRQELARKCGVSVGDIVEFVRHGNPVEFSTNHQDGTLEVGMSCYLLAGSEVKYVGFWFDIASRPAFIGTGEVVGWGSDGEPLVKVLGKCVRATEYDR